MGFTVVTAECRAHNLKAEGLNLAATDAKCPGGRLQTLLASPPRM
jgi:hypothetical protein